MDAELEAIRGDLEPRRIELTARAVRRPCRSHVMPRNARFRGSGGAMGSVGMAPNVGSGIQAGRAGGATPTPAGLTRRGPLARQDVRTDRLGLPATSLYDPSPESTGRPRDPPHPPAYHLPPSLAPGCIHGPDLCDRCLFVRAGDEFISKRRALVPVGGGTARNGHTLDIVWPCSVLLAAFRNDEREETPDGLLKIGDLLPQEIEPDLCCLRITSCRGQFAGPVAELLVEVPQLPVPFRGDSPQLGLAAR